MENLYAAFLLWFHGFNTNEVYESSLNDAFLNSGDNDILLELEELSSNMLSTHERFMQYWNYECPNFNADIFGKRLFAGLEIVYKSNALDLNEFCRRCYQLWNDLPSDIQQTEPFFTLCYADDYLSSVDEAQARKLYEKAFKFYA